ncbi:CPBP family intramembrane metalloprotease [Candidatus Saccharibacteria bacterium]|nr:CPBP family intramembrane metalloprotease [Candidatus Saccharibacteria bacterium]
MKKVIQKILGVIAITAWVGIVYIVVQKLLALIIVGIFRPAVNTTALQTLYSMLCYIVSGAVIIFLPWGIVKLLKKTKWGQKLLSKFKTKNEFKPDRDELGVIGWPTWIDLGLAPVGFVAYLLLANVIVSSFTHFSWFNLEEKQDVGYNTMIFGPERMLPLTVLVVVAPIVEEVIFRGYLYGKLKKCLGVRSNKNSSKKERRRSLILTAIAILITSILFGVMHRQWNVGVNVFAMSIVLCLMREITGSIYAGIIMHMIKNAVAFYLLFVVGLG